MRKRLTNNLGMKLIALVLAVVIWLVVYSIADPKITRLISSVPVETVNNDAISDINKTYSITEGDYATFYVEGRTSIVSQLTSADFTATADLEKMSVVGAVPVEIKCKRTGVTVLSHANTLKIVMEDLEEKTLNAVLKPQGTVAEGYYLDKENCVLSPNLIRISGPKSFVDRVSEAGVVVNVEGQTADISTIEDITLYDAAGNQLTIGSNMEFLTGSSIQVSVNVYKTKEIDVNFVLQSTAAEGYEITATNTAEKLLIAGPDEVLDQITEISVKDEKVRNLTESVEGLCEVKLPSKEAIIVDESIRNGLPYSITVIQKVEGELEVPWGDIVLQNNDDAYDYELKSGVSVDVAITGIPDELAATKKGTYQIAIDVADLAPGEHTVALTAAFETNVALVPAQMVTIIVSEK